MTAGVSLRPLYLAAAALAGLSMATPARAQTAQDQSVGGRAHADFEPIGMQLGSFLFHAGLTNEGEYNDNIFRDTTHTSDGIARLKPSLSLIGDVADTNIALTADSEIARYVHYHSENYEDYKFAGAVKQDVTEESNIGLSVSHARLHTPRGGLNDPGRAFGPSLYELSTIGLAPQYSVSPFVGNLKLEGRYYDYLRNGPIDNSDQSEYQLLASNRMGYRFDAGWSLFLEPSYQLHNFVKRVDRNGVNHDSQMVQGLVGFTYDATADLFLELGVGYFQQLFFAADQQNLSGTAFTGSLIWNVNDVLSLTGALARAVQDTVSATGQFASVSSLVTSTGSLRADYEAADNLVTYAGVSLETDEYSGVTLNEDIFTFTGGATYYFNEYLSAGLRYNFDARTSTDVTRRIDNNRITMELTVRM